MGFGNYGICDLWDFGIMGEGGRRGAKQREKGRARALVHHFFCPILPRSSISHRVHPQCSLADVIIHIINYKVAPDPTAPSSRSQVQIPPKS